MNNWRFVLRLMIILALIIFDVYAVRAFYKENQHLPFTVPYFIEKELQSVLPEPTSLSQHGRPLYLDVEITQAQWIGSIVYGKLTNHASVPVTYPTLRFALSTSKDETSVLKAYTATISARLAPDESVYFSQRFPNVPSGAFWWSTQLTAAQEDTGARITSTPSGQKLSKNPLLSSKSAVAQQDKGPWGVAKQLDDVTWTIKVGQDERMATPQDTFDALNNYRKTHGSGTLVWDENLATFAQQRAIYLNSIQSTDKHKGFEEYTANDENVRKLGFYKLGENIGYGSKLIGVHLIEWIYASDEGHNKNQLNPEWTHVGIGISGLGVAFEFGGDKM